MSKTGKNIYKRKDGRWEGRYIKEYDSNGKARYRSVFGKTYAEAESKREAALLKDAANKKEKGIFETIAKEWLNNQKPQLKASSISKYTNILNSHLIPQFGSWQFRDITRHDVMIYSRELLSSKYGLSPKTANNILSVLKSIFKYANKELSLNIPDINDISVRQPQKPIRILSIEEQSRLSHYLYDNLNTCFLGILISLYTGIRIGEICALKWSEINLQEHYIYVQKTMQRIQIEKPYIEGKKTKIVVQAPKSNCSIRKIPIPDRLLQLLILYRAPEEAYLLTGSENRFMEPRSLENQFKSVAKKCNIVNINYHTLRHTFATRCIELGFDLKSLSEILGHASVNITLNRYVHPSMDLKQRNMDKLSDFLTNL